ncbi:MAG: DUF503 domain-containing protein [Acidobacteria bacterium]|nr:DUF503 domain-containing protein [Acidobacteriota bacterium]
MVVGLLTVELHIPHARSLKDKRMVLRSVKDRLHALNVAVAEVEYTDLWQRAGLAVVGVSGTGVQVEKELSAAVDAIERAWPGLITRTQVELLT